MGDIIGGIVGGIGSIIGGNKSAKAAREAAKTARLGFDWASSNPNFKGFLETGGKANNAIGNLLGIGGDPAQAQAAFDNYKNSTGYKFRLGEGMGAITGSNAAKGLLNSGDTLRRLTGYGQDLASAEYNNYLGQLGNLANMGLATGQTIASAGSQAGATGAGIQWQGAQAQGNAFNNALANFGYAANSAWDKWGGKG